MESFEIPLDLKDVKIETVEFTKNHEVLITVRSTLDEAFCHQCGRNITDFYGYDREITLRHLSILGKQTFIKIRPKRYQCPYCQDRPKTTQKLEWYEPRSLYTKAYGTHILLSLVNSTILDVSLKEEIGYEAVMGIIDRSVYKKVDWNELKELPILGIDEIALKKGHRNFVTVITARLAEGKNRVLAILEDRRKATVKAFFSSIPKGLRKTVHVVCSDLYEGYIHAAREVFGRKVRVTADRFHVAKLYRKGLDHLRQKEMKRLKAELPKDQYKELNSVMWALRKHPNNATPEELDVLKKLFKLTPLLGTAYLFCYTLTHIFEQPITKAEARSKLRAWKSLVQNSELDCFDRFLRTLEERMDEITNYFTERHNSGFVEGLNNKIKVIKRRCYGILNIDHLFQRLIIDLTGYEKFA